jgi:hypothetical protein
VGACQNQSACVDGVHHPCEPLPPLREQDMFCDGVDENCDGIVDGNVTRTCENACGVGVQACHGGDWPACAVTSDSGEICVDIFLFCETIPLALELTLPTPEEGLGVDVVFLFDRSGSFGDDLETFRNKATELMDALAEEIADLRVGLSSFVDAPCGEFGYAPAGDFGYQMDLALTHDLTRLGSSLWSLDIRNGWDWPESQLEAMYQALTGEGVVVTSPPALAGCVPGANIASSDLGWGTNRLGFLFVSTDADFHRPHPATWGYPYPHGTADVLAAAQDLGTVISFLYAPGTIDSDAYVIADATGGRVFELSHASAEIAETVTEAIFEVLTNVEVEVVAEGDYLGFVTGIHPTRLRGVDLLTNRRLQTSVTLLSMLEATGHEQHYAFDLVFYINGREVDRRPVSVTIPAQNLKGCTNRPPIVRRVSVPTTLPTLGSASVTVLADEPDGEPMTYHWTASAGTLGEPSSSASSYAAPAEPGLVTFEVVVTDPQGASDWQRATTLVTGGSCLATPYLFELGLTEGRMVLEGALNQASATGSCGGTGAEALVHLRVHDERAYRLTVEPPGGWSVYVRGDDCASEMACGAGGLTTAFGPGDYLLFVDSASASVGTAFKLYAEPL